MAVTRSGHSVILVALNDAITDSLTLRSLRLVGTGMTVAQRLTIQENNGAVLFDAYVDNVNCNMELIQGEHQVCNGLKLSAVPAAGTFSVIGRL